MRNRCVQRSHPACESIAPLCAGIVLKRQKSSLTTARRCGYLNFPPSNFEMTQDELAERRRCARTAYTATVHATEIPRRFLAGDLELLAEDISATGVRLSAPECLPLESQLLLRLDALSSEPPIQIVGKVVWVEPETDPDRCQLGIEFSDISNGSGTRLLQLVAQQQQTV
jgi:hypothetical protein